VTRRRWIRLVLALVLVALLVLLASRFHFVEVKVPAALRGEAATNPFYAAIRLVDELDASAEWSRVIPMDPREDAIFLSDWNWSLNQTRQRRIRTWVENGGRLVVDFSMNGDLAGFEEWTGISVDEADDEEVEAKSKQDEEAGKDKPTATESAVQKILELKPCTGLVEDGTGRRLEVCDVGFPNYLAVARKPQWVLRDGKYIHAARVAIGKGSVTVLNADAFKRRDFLLGDHAQLLVAILQLRKGDDVMFLTEQDHASIVALMWRYGAPAVLLLALLIALGLWRSAARFGPLIAPPETARRSLAEQIRGTGQFALRFGGGKALHAAAARALRDAAISHLASYDRLSSEERVAAIAKLSALPADDIGPALHFTGARNSHELRNAIEILESARRRILLKNRRQKHGN
jgi:hypothetical protein